MIKKKILEYYIWSDIEQELNTRLQRNIDDYYGNSQYHTILVQELKTIYHDSSWYTTTPSVFTEEQLKIHNIYIERMKEEPKLCSFWNWWINNCLWNELHNGSYIPIDICEIKDTYIENIETPIWIQEILIEFVNIFKEQNESYFYIYYSR